MHDNGERLGQRDDFQRFSVLIFHGLKPLQIFLQRREVRIGRIIIDDGDDCRWADEAREIIHMPARVVALDPLSEPENVGDGKIILKMLLDLFFCEIRIPVGIEKTVFRRQQRPLSVYIDRSPPPIPWEF